MNPDIDALLILPHIQVQNANAISGPFTWGFPSPTAFAGFVHALNRKTKEFHDLTFCGVGVVCHAFDPQVFSPPGKYNRVFCLRRHPNSKDGSTAAFVEEGRAHMEISLVVGLRGESLFDGTFSSEKPFQGISNNITSLIEETIYTMRLAGGSILGARKPYVLLLPPDAQDIQKATRKFARRFLPGFALISRDDLLSEAVAESREKDPPVNGVDVLLDQCSLVFEPQRDPEDVDKAQWTIRSKPGWLVPVPIGYGAISDLYSPAEVQNARDQDTPFRFVESLCSLGQWISPHRITDIRELLWYYAAEPEKGLYQCVNYNQFNS
jgi:CRISPR-associated protein Csy2